jgi:hypothetical protein
MNKQRSILILLFRFIVYKSSSLDFKITQLQLDFSDNQLNSTYNLDNKNSTGKFQTRIEIKRQIGKLIQPDAMSGDIGENIKEGNNKEIIWNVE